MKRVLLGSALALLLVAVTASYATANVVTPDDTAQVKTLLSKALSLGKEIGRSTSPASATLYCNLILEDQSSFVRSDLQETFLVLTIAEAMKAKADEDVALEASSDSLENLMAGIPGAREAANYVQGSCGVSSPIGLKAKVLLELTDEIAKAVKPLQQKIGAAKR